jgi:hypothetical protein
MKIERSFTFAFRADGAGGKLLRGWMYSLLFFTVFFAFVVVGYVMRVLCSALEGRDARLPDWDDLTSLFHEGIQPVIVLLVYTSPVTAILILQMYSDAIPIWTPGVALLLTSLLLPLALIRSVVVRSIGAAFDLRHLFSFIGRNLGAFSKSWFFSVSLGVVAGIVGFGLLLASVWLLDRFGMRADVRTILIGIGVSIPVFALATFLSSIVTSHLYAQMYRSSKPFDDDREGEMRASIAMPPPIRR